MKVWNRRNYEVKNMGRFKISAIKNMSDEEICHEFTIMEGERRRLNGKVNFIVYVLLKCEIKKRNLKVYIR